MPRPEFAPSLGGSFPLILKSSKLISKYKNKLEF